ncbi:hypothetical protein TSA1_29730 [Bradyrhizobium nitroreducens]|uniref:Uncharacterized protein n=1 Tax=Bradyrhizobium nitroreducens TaxID=709803 RepID=A0A2M6UIP0_9BRAD|nr:hypothetical protein TSA1_29730 [Bradyrhizobium nitroreducens]
MFRQPTGGHVLGHCSVGIVHSLFNGARNEQPPAKSGEQFFGIGARNLLEVRKIISVEMACQAYAAYAADKTGC